MKLLVFSDLHLELRPRWSLNRKWPDYDVAVCAGDISDSIALSVAYLATHPVLGSKPVILVAGNHEYWGQEIHQAEEAGRWAARGTNVHFLQGRAVTIGGVTFVGSTLWTDYALSGDRLTSASLAAGQMNDHHRISIETPRSTGRPFMPGDAIDLHEIQKCAMDNLLKNANGHTVAVTHHLPSAKSIDQGLSGELDPAYASDLEDIISSRQPNLWIHGHTHVSKNYAIGNTRIVCNPKGYGPSRSGEGRFATAENPEFQPKMIIEI